MGAMKAATADERIGASKQLEATEIHKAQSTVLLATNDPEIRENIEALLQSFPLKTICAKGIGEMKSILASESVIACLCGFWLVDGTYRDVVRYLKLQPVEIPAIIVCAPSCPHDYRDYLAALNISAFDLICHPYRKADIERILCSAIDSRGHNELSRLTSRSPSISMPSLAGLRRAS